MDETVGRSTFCHESSGSDGVWASEAAPAHRSSCVDDEYVVVVSSSEAANLRVGSARGRRWRAMGVLLLGTVGVLLAACLSLQSTPSKSSKSSMMQSGLWFHAGQPLGTFYPQYRLGAGPALATAPGIVTTPGSPRWVLPNKLIWGNGEVPGLSAQNPMAPTLPQAPLGQMSYPRLHVGQPMSTALVAPSKIYGFSPGFKQSSLPVQITRPVYLPQTSAGPPTLGYETVPVLPGPRLVPPRPLPHLISRQPAASVGSVAPHWRAERVMIPVQNIVGQQLRPPMAATPVQPSMVTIPRPQGVFWRRNDPANVNSGLIENVNDVNPDMGLPAIPRWKKTPTPLIIEPLPSTHRRKGGRSNSSWKSHAFKGDQGEPELKPTDKARQVNNSDVVEAVNSTATAEVNMTSNATNVSSADGQQNLTVKLETGSLIRICNSSFFLIEHNGSTSQVEPCIPLKAVKQQYGSAVEDAVHDMITAKQVLKLLNKNVSIVSFPKGAIIGGTAADQVDVPEM